MDKFFGGNPLMVMVKLAIVSLVVGIVMAALNLDALSLLQNLKAMVVRIYEMGFGAVEWIFQYFLLGAVIVFPIWLIARLLKVMGNKEGRPS
jgi:hypothetical protein